MKLTVPIHDSNRFTFNKKTNTFSAEASDLGSGTLFSRYYDDACDVGFQMRSGRTGKIVDFILMDIEKGTEGEIVAWHFEDNLLGPCELRVVIFND